MAITYEWHPDTDNPFIMVQYRVKNGIWEPTGVEREANNEDLNNSDVREVILGASGELGKRGAEGAPEGQPLPKRPSGPQDALVPIGMNNDGGDGDEPMALGAMQGGGTNPQSKETPVSTYPSLSYGLQNTHTTILPYRVWYSFGLLDHATPLQANFRMNAVWDMALSTPTTLADAGTIAAKALHTLPVGPGGVNVTGVTFPQTPVNGATERPQWRDYWANFYGYYTVLGCKWKATIVNSSNTRGGDIEVAVQYDSYSDTTTATGNVMPVTTYAETKAFKNIEWHVARASTSESNYTQPTVISGEYRPGTIGRNIVNDGDVKTWTAVGTTLPTLKEILTINFFKAGLNYASAANTCGNVCVELDYIVQFKDLKQQAIYPNSVTTDQDISCLINDTNGLTQDDVRMLQSNA